jgi:single-stranded-DNA-specific exonuclease
VNWVERECPAQARAALCESGLSDLMARLLAARGVAQPDELDVSMARLLPPDGLRGVGQAAELLGQAIERQHALCLVADYDCDGATACAVAIRGLQLLGAAPVSFVVPDRQRDGYGLTPSIAARVRDLGAQVLITVDNGIASVAGVSAARQMGLRVVVTDHHLPGPQLPEADALVNPNQAGCGFASKHLAGVGVMFYVLLATRSWLRAHGHFQGRAEPRLDGLLPLVALGTVADVVTLDANNRRLVHQGLARIRRGQMPAGLRALWEVSGRDHRLAHSQDLGFVLGPRINAAGRLSDMRIGIECLLTEDPAQAQALAQTLHDINLTRREVEGEMREQALALAERQITQADQASALCLFDPHFHEGVIGIVAGRLKDLHHRPTFVFAPALDQADLLKGSGRSIAGFHLRDALDAISKQHTDMLVQFGGHAMAAGCTLRREQLPVFERALQTLARQWVDPTDLARVWVVDGDLSVQDWTPAQFAAMEEQVWGSGFAPPLFRSSWRVLSQRVVGDKHLKLRLMRAGLQTDAIWFGHTDALPPEVDLLYRPQINRWQGRMTLEIQIEDQAQSASDLDPKLLQSKA